MCASYGLDPRFKDTQQILGGDQELVEQLRAWADANAGETMLPTGKNLRNLNPIVQERDGRLVMQLGWWGYLIGGEPAKFPSINTRSERILERGEAVPARAIVPATTWFDMQKPSRQWFQFEREHLDLLAMAALVRPGRTPDGASFTCYSLVMRPSTDALAPIHDRAPLLIPGGFVDEWLTSTEAPRDLVEEALAQSETVLETIEASAITKRP